MELCGTGVDFNAIKFNQVDKSTLIIDCPHLSSIS
jgi:hypothetical protein